MRTWEQLENEIYGMAEKGYADFSLSLTPTNYKMLGVRIPYLRALAKSVASCEVENLLDSAKFNTFEEVMLYGFLLSKIKVVDAKLFERIDEFLTRADNWAHIDCVTTSLKIIDGNEDLFLNRYAVLADHDGVFHRRFLAVMLLDWYCGDDYFFKAMDIYHKIKQGDYYVDMAIAWGLSVMMVKNFNAVITSLKAGDFSLFVTKKAIQKGIESRRISDENKARLKELRSYFNGK